MASGLCDFHWRGDPVPADWYEITPKFGKVSKIGEIRFGSPALSQILEDGSRSLKSNFSPAIIVDGCDHVEIRFTPPLHFKLVSRNG